MPRPIVPPYTNIQARLKGDFAKNQRFAIANASFSAKRPSKHLLNIQKSSDSLTRQNTEASSPYKNAEADFDRDMAQRGRNFRASQTQEMTASQASLKQMYATCSPSMMQAKWNKKLQSQCGDKNSAMNRMNVGTSYFVAPYNHSTNQDIIKVVESNHEQVLTDLSRIVKRFEAEEAEKTKYMSEEILAQRKNQKPASITRVEQLITKIAANKAGVQVHGREIRKPSETIVNRLNQHSPRNP